MTKDNTILAMDLFEVESKDLYIFHIPHSSSVLPSMKGYHSGLVDDEILKLTDWATERIFDVPGTEKIIAEFNRIYCDVERFADDELEPMSVYGRGFFYTKTDNGKTLRENDIENKTYIYENYYLPHHDRLNEVVNRKLATHQHAIIIDCHSFSDLPFESDLIKDDERPDICIGTDDFHTPSYLKNKIILYFEEKGYSVRENNPYSGTMVNSESYLKNKQIYSIMIEINRKLYMSNDTVDERKVRELNDVIRKLFDSTYKSLP